MASVESAAAAAILPPNLLCAKRLKRPLRIETVTAPWLMVRVDSSQPMNGSIMRIDPKDPTNDLRMLLASSRHASAQPFSFTVKSCRSTLLRPYQHRKSRGVRLLQSLLLFCLCYINSSNALPSRTFPTSTKTLDRLRRPITSERRILVQPKEEEDMRSVEWSVAAPPLPQTTNDDDDDDMSHSSTAFVPSSAADLPYFANLRYNPPLSLIQQQHANGILLRQPPRHNGKVQPPEALVTEPIITPLSVDEKEKRLPPSLWANSRRQLAAVWSLLRNRWGRRRREPRNTANHHAATLSSSLNPITIPTLPSSSSFLTPPTTLRSLWRRRSARSAEEGIRREHVAPPPKKDRARQLSSVLAKANASIERTSRRVAARTLTGLITAMAEEVADLNVEVDARDETPYREKHITAVRIQFSRLGFKPLRMGGHDSPDDHRQQRQAVSQHHSHLMHQLRSWKKEVPEGDSSSSSSSSKLMGLLSWEDNDYNEEEWSSSEEVVVDHIDADEAFDRIDVDNSGFLDRKELIQALGLAAIVSNDKALVLEDMESDSHVSILEELAADLFELYDVNGDGVVDRREYKMMVADMAALRHRDLLRHRRRDAAATVAPGGEGGFFSGPLSVLQNKTSSMLAAGMELLQNKTAFLVNSTAGVDFFQEKTGFLSSGVEFVQNKTGSLATGVSAGVEYVQNKTGFLYSGVEYVQNTTGYLATTGIDFLQNNSGFAAEYVQNNSAALTSGMEFVKGKLAWPPPPPSMEQKGSKEESLPADVVADLPEVVESFSKSLGSITFSDIKMDLRRLFFGAIPIVKHLVPGGPLILEPFSTTITGSFNRHDIMNSYLLDAGLRRLVMRALRRRVGFLRDLLEGAMFKGRSWKTYGDEGGPRVEIPELTNVEFDENDKLIITGRARVQTSPDASVIHQSFKVRTSIGTRKNGRYIRLEQPELALVIECPESWEKNVEQVCDALHIEKPPRPSPIYTFFPIYSPFKLEDDLGFDLGEDNAITSLYIKDGALRFEMSAILRPGRFLGSHYIAFSIPIRTFIVTLDRLVEGIRSARKVKKAVQRALARTDEGATKKRRNPMRRLSLDGAGDALLALKEDRMKNAANKKSTKMKSFFSRFIDGYLQAERDEAKKERLTTAIQDFFARQGEGNFAI